MKTPTEVDVFSISSIPFPDLAALIVRELIIVIMCGMYVLSWNIWWAFVSFRRAGFINIDF